MRWRWSLPCAVLILAACGEETPTSIEGGLLPGDVLTSFEVVLEPERYLVEDTAFGFYSTPAGADVAILANAYGGVLDSRVLVQFTIPRTIAVIDTAGVLRTDSMPTFIGGEVRLIVDTLAVSSAGELRLHRATEAWDRTSATWSLRVDTGDVQLPWAQPGGSPGVLVSTTQVDADADTARLAVDAATIAEWADTSMAGRGAVIAAGTPGTRMRTGSAQLLVRARSTMQPDTVVEITTTPLRTFIYSPQLPEATAGPRVGGIPAWRTMLQLRERLDTLAVPCPGTDCLIRLSDTHVTYAGLVLQPVPSPAGFEPEAPLFVNAHVLLPSSRVPLERSPVTDAFSGLIAPVPPSSFTTPGAPTIEVPLTDVLRRTLRTPETGDPAQVTNLALLAPGRTFGVGSFAERPRLRLILTIARELMLP